MQPTSCQLCLLGCGALFMASSLRCCCGFHYWCFYASQSSLAKGNEYLLKNFKPHICSNTEKENRKTNWQFFGAACSTVSQEWVWDVGCRVSQCAFSLSFSAAPTIFTLVLNSVLPLLKGLCHLLPPGHKGLFYCTALYVCVRSRTKPSVQCCRKPNGSLVLNFLLTGTLFLDPKFVFCSYLFSITS